MIKDYSIKKPPITGWITWEIQPRNKNMSNLLDVPLYELIINSNRAIKYPQLIIKTIAIVFFKRINILFVQNPSIVLSFLAVIIKLITGKKVFIDAHNAGIFPQDGKSLILTRVANFIIRNADLTIVSNQYLASVVGEKGGNPYVMPDPIPSFSHKLKKTPPICKPYVLFVCSWASDEPYWEVIRAAEKLSGIDIYITGEFKNKISKHEISTLSPAINLLGFVSEEDYLMYFQNAQIAIDLTTRDHCLVCGAYEAAAIGIPAILSDTQINREVFNDGFLYTKNNAADIATTIIDSFDRQASLKTDILSFAIRHTEEMNNKATQFKASFM